MYYTQQKWKNRLLQYIKNFMMRKLQMRF